MRPRQNLRDYHHNSHPTYQSMNHNPNLLQQQRQQPMLPTHQPSGTPPLLGPTSASAATRVIQPPLPTSDLISELIKLGLNPEDMAKQSNRPADLLRNLQAILGKREAADLLQKLSLSEMFMQSQSEFARGGSSGVGSGSRDSVICGPSGISGPPSGPTSFINSINNGNSNKQEQDIQYSSAHHQANHHQQFRIPATNSTAVHNSPQQQQQHKQSVLSLHQQQQQQQQQHQQDPANRRMNDQQHIMTTASSSSYGNLNDMSGRNIPTSSLEPHNPSIYNRRKPSPPVNSYTGPSASSTARALNPMDTLGASSGSGHPGQLDSNMYDNPAFQQHNVSPANQQQSLIRHQQLQKLLRSAANGPSKSNMPLPLSSMSARTDPQTNSQRNSMNSLAQMQRQMTSPNTSSAISPPQQPLSSVPKSLLNLAACTSKSPPVTNNVTSIAKSNRNLTSNYTSSAASGGSNNPSMPNNRVITPRQSNSSNSAFNNRIPDSVDPTNLLQHMISRSNQAKNSNNAPIRNTQNSNTLTSLLADEQRAARSNTGQPTSQHPSNVTKLTNPIPAKRQPQSTNDTNVVQGDLKSKGAYLAYLQERAAKAGISIGEICQGPTRQNNVAQPSSDSAEVSGSSVRDPPVSSSNQKNNEARNDLSLLYPPVELATSSQRQVSLLAAGMDLSEGVDVITDEVRKIIQYECNIIYECKGCSNLFRSLANLVKHKRQFCDNSNIERANSELNKQFHNTASSELPNPSRTPIATEQSRNRLITGSDNRDTSIIDARRTENLNASVSIGSQKYNLRGRRIDATPDTPNQVRSTRMTRSHDRKGLISGTDPQMNPDRNIPSQQTNLSRLLQSQPKSMQPTTKESALMDALNMPNPATNRRSLISNPRNCSVNEINEQLVKSSSLAKTLLNESAKSMNSCSPAMQLARAVAQQPKTGPKRKFLEDCIQKVKRDKLGTGEEEDQDDPTVAQCSMDRKKMDRINQFKDPLALDDSETDSDALVMDLDEPNGNSRSRRKGSRDSRSEDERIYNSPSNNRINTSSALLKALTRPVESKSMSGVGNTKSPDDPLTESLDAASTEVRSTGTEESGLNETAVVEDSESSNSTADCDLEIVPPSPLFDKYTCEMCSTDLEDQSSLLAHIMEEHKKESKIYPCLFCSFTFITLENVCRHIIDIHRKTKTQVRHLKEVVRSRSFISQDFKTCSDCPPTISQPADAKCEEESEISNKTTSDMAETRRSSSALSDSAATKQILEDTLALVSDTTSPDAAHSAASTSRFSKMLSRSRSSDRPTASSPDRANAASLQAGAVDDDNEDPLCDSLMNNLTEHLAILESQEAEIEAEKQRRQQAFASQANESSLELAGDGGYIQVDGTPRRVKQESHSNIIPPVHEDEISEVSVEPRNQQTTPSRGKHIVAGQPFDTEESHNTDQDDDGDDDDLEFIEKEPRDVMADENSAYDEDIDEPEEAGSDGSNYNQYHEETDDGESANSPDQMGSIGHDAEDCADGSDGQHEKDFRVRSGSRSSSRRVHKRRRSSRNDDVEEDGNFQSFERLQKSDTDLSPSLASDKGETQNSHDLASASDGSCHHSLKAASKISTIEGGCKLKLKSSILRDVCTGSGSSATGSQQGSSSADGSGAGGIKKLKIQLKAQPDEKSKVYRIVN